MMSRFEVAIDQWLRETPKITATRISQLIRQTIDPTFQANERTVREYVATRRVRIIPKETFVRLAYSPGEQVQFDFKDVVALIGGVETQLHLFVARLSYSTAFFARAYRSEDRPALFDGLVASCVCFGGIPHEGVFDNATAAIRRVLRGRNREMNPAFSVLCGDLALPMQFAAPAKGNEKGGVEGLHGYIEDNFFRPIPEYTSLQNLNMALDTFVDRYLEKPMAGERVIDRLERERSALRPLPTILPETCIRESVRINKFAEVTYRTNRYSVPSKFSHRDAILEVFHNRIRIVVDTIPIAEHERSFNRHDAVLDLLHFIDLLSYKHRAVTRAEVFRRPEFNQILRSLLKDYTENDPETAGKRFMRVIALLENHSMKDVVRSVQSAKMRGTDDPAAIELLLRQEEHPYQVVPPLSLPPETRGFSCPATSLNSYDLDSLKELAI